MNNLLLDEYPLLVMPNLATKIGLNESIILQQIHYWLEINKKTNNNFKDGFYWSYNSYEKWQEQFPFWSLSTIKRTIKKLESYGLVISGNYNKMKIDRTKWYRIDYEMLEKVDTCELVPLGQNDPINESNCTNHNVSMNKPIPEIKTNTKSKNTSIGNFDKQNPTYSFFDVLNSFEIKEETKVYIAYYYANVKTEKYTYYFWETIINNLNDNLECYGDMDYIEDIVDKYIETPFNAHSLYHSTLPNVLGHRMQELGLISYMEEC